MRFSLKWILAGMAYAALAAAALTQNGSVYADVLWAVTFVTFEVALVVACFARDKRQIVAASFVAFSGCYLLCLHFAPASLPTSKWLLEWRVGDEANVVPRLPTLQRTVLDTPAEYHARLLEVQLIYAKAAAAVAAAEPKPVDLMAYLRAGNAVAMMAFGLLGCLVGLMALRAAKPNAGPPPRPEG